jgi:hypothetical protein
MLALAFTVHVAPPAPAPPAPPPVAVAAPAPSVAVPAAPVASLPDLPVLTIETPLAISSAVALLLVGAFALRVRAERAPPTA